MRDRAPSLSARMFRSILAFTLAGIVVFSLALAAIFYLSFEHKAASDLMAQTHRAAQYLDSESPEQRLAVLEEQFDGNVRYTLINANGTVVYDSAAPGADLSQLENHGDRPEVQEALAGGEGATSRHSATLGTDTLYAAAPLADGSVIRLSETRDSLVAFFANDMMPPVTIALLAAAALVLALSRLLTRNLMRPLDRIDVSAPLENTAYTEMEPLLARIDSQQRTLRAQNQELALAESLRRDFSANVSHELKTPLQVISGYAELMAHGLVATDDVRKFGSVIHQESQTMRALIDDVLVLSRLDEKGLSADETALLDLTATVAHAAERLEKPARDKGVSIALALQPAQVSGSETLLEQMAYNLIENAIRYNYPGGRVTVEVLTEDAGGLSREDDTRQLATESANPLQKLAILRVSDTGPGIPPEAREKVFERFYRLDKSRSKETGGTGLGLAIVKHTALRHGGSVAVDSAPGGGARFTVILPQAR